MCGMFIGMRRAKPQTAGGLVGDVLDDTISDDEMDRLFAEDHDEINALLREAYDAKDRGECARLEPLHVILAQERTRFNSSRG